MKICPNLSNPQVKEDFETLKTIFGENEAYYLWNKNGGYFLDRTSEGDLNTIYTTAYENYNNKEYALKIAALELLKGEYQIEDIKPTKITTTIELGKQILNNILEGYGMNSKGQFKLEEDQAISLNDAIHAAGLKDVNVVSIGNKYQLYDNSLNKYVLPKDIKNNPKYVLSASDLQSSVKTRILEELKKLGVRVDVVDSLNSQYGIDAVAVADIASKAIKFANNEIPFEALGEEGAHFFVEAMNDTPFINRLMNLVKQNEAYKSILEDDYSAYNQVYRNNEDMLAKEAIGKLLGQYLTDPNTLAYKPAKSLLERLWMALKSIFASKNTQDLDRLLNSELQQFAHDILMGKATKMSKKSLWKSSSDKLFRISNKASKLEEVMKKMIETEGLRLKIFESSAFTNIQTIENQKNIIADLVGALEKGTVKERIASYISNSTYIIKEMTDMLAREEELQSKNSISKSAHVARRMKSFMNSVRPIVNEMQTYIKEDNSDPEFNKELSTTINDFLAEANYVNNELQYKMFNIFAKFIGMNFDKFADVENPFGEKLTKEQVIEKIAMADKDNNWFNRYISAASDNPDIVTNLVSMSLKNSEHDVRMKTQNAEYRLRNAYMKLRDAGITDLTVFLEKDSEGNYTQNFISEWDYSGYEKAREEFLKELWSKFPQNPYERNKAFAANPSLEKEWTSMWADFNMKWVERVKGWENIMMQKKNSLPKSEYLRWKAKNIREFMDTKGNVHFSPSVYGELAHPKVKSKAFEELKKDPAKLEFYNTLNGLMQEALEMLPHNIRGVTPNMAPRTRATFNERLTQEGLRGAFKGEDFLSSIEIRADEDQFGNRYQESLQDFEGNTVQFLPIYYTAKIKNATFSTDVLGSVLQFYNMASNYNIKSRMIDILEVGKDVLSERLVKIGNNGLESKVSIPILGNLIQRRNKEKAEALFKGYKTLINKGLYGEYQEKEGSFKVYLPFYGEVNVDRAKLANLGRDAVTYMMLAGSPFVGLANQFTGELTILNEAASKRFFTVKDRAFASKEILKLMPEFMKEVGDITPDSKLWYMMSYFNVLGEYDQHMQNVKSNVKNKLMRALTGDSLMAFISSGDFMNKLTVSIALMHHTKVLNAEGKEVTLYDQFEVKDGIPGLKEGTKNLDGTAYTKEDLKAFFNRQSKLNAQLFGMVDNIDRAPAQTKAIGRMLLIFRTFMGPNLNRRFSKNKLDTSLGVYTEGYYNTFGKFLKTIAKDAAHARFSILTNWNNLTEGQKQNMAIALTEMASMAVMATLVFILGALAKSAGDDEEKRLRALQLMIARTNSEIAALSPFGLLGETTRIFQSPTALMGLVDRVTDILNITNLFETYESGTFEGYNKGLIKMLRLIPGNRLVFDFLTVEDKLKFYGLD